MHNTIILLVIRLKNNYKIIIYQFFSLFNLDEEKVMMSFKLRNEDFMMFMWEI